MRSFTTLIIGSLLLLLGNQVIASDVRVQYARDLQADAQQARERKLPVLVLFSASHCGYCTIVREDFLRPMLISGDYQDKVIIRMLEIDSSDPLLDFEGNRVFADALADRLGVSFTPTVKFFDPNGREIVPGIVGLLTVDFYGGYLDAAIEESLAQLRGQRKLASNR